MDFIGYHFRLNIEFRVFSFSTVARRDINNRQRRIGASTAIDFCSQPSNPYGTEPISLSNDHQGSAQVFLLREREMFT
jgi:hypothetical protein